MFVFFFLMIRRPPRSTQSRSSAASDVYKRQLYAIEDYGRVIHEFDPWFNFRATQYLADNGWDKFFKWFDYMSWYPLGRPVGTTIYPGMQITSVFIWKVLTMAVSYTHLRAHETVLDLVCRLLLEKKKKEQPNKKR
eukprot:TRINITY_DN17351_c0_g1_i1.p1 TRINITY_DN17351_c0_g1~~TRINITY_DN17351_c0_g1_i1.p1  ORF type:complete len:136 (-),score=84.13 TRINITY_DN17351_c0_g1_i1:95-502(-)